MQTAKTQIFRSGEEVSEQQMCAEEGAFAGLLPAACFSKCMGFRLLAHEYRLRKER